MVCHYPLRTLNWNMNRQFHCTVPRAFVHLIQIFQLVSLSQSLEKSYAILNQFYHFTCIFFSLASVLHVTSPGVPPHLANTFLFLFSRIHPTDPNNSNLFHKCRLQVWKALIIPVLPSSVPYFVALGLNIWLGALFLNTFYFSFFFLEWTRKFLSHLKRAYVRY